MASPKSWKTVACEEKQCSLHPLPSQLGPCPCSPQATTAQQICSKSKHLLRAKPWPSLSRALHPVKPPDRPKM